MISYPIVCPSCHGRGEINNPTPGQVCPFVICPACNGSKVVIATDSTPSMVPMVPFTPSQPWPSTVPYPTSPGLPKMPPIEVTCQCGSNAKRNETC